MDALPLPPRPNLDQYRKRAKELVDAARAGDPDAIRVWASDWLTALTQALDMTTAPNFPSLLKQAIEVLVERTQKRIDASAGGFALADAQHLIATIHGFDTWAAFARHVDAPFKGDSHGREFEAAVDAVVSGDLPTLQRLIAAQPDLVRQHSTREHRATLLHYVAANGVEDYRQRTPPNAVEIARFLLDSGAKADALADTYGRDYWQTTMNLLVSSAHPDGAGLMSPLVELLLDYGAAINGVKDDESPILTAIDFGYIYAAETLARRGARVDNVITAASLGRVDLVSAFVVDKYTLAPGVPLIAPAWRNLATDARTHIEAAFVYACRFERVEVATRLLERGVDVAAADGQKMTALHHAAAHGLIDLARALIARGAPLEVKNMWGGTVLDSTAYFAEFMPIKGVDYTPVLQMLVDAGANVRVLDDYPADGTVVPQFLARRGS
ncbi:MAG TPA: ankyrin repeat domain-containing protein [Vicinamibacterales bacterium]|nr:ankyrin repeat domain-containing protein [Vicinamibacterales bacterium]